MAILWVAMSFSDKPVSTHNLTLSFNHFVGNELLKLDSATYKNNMGQTFNVSKFRYYISNVYLKNNSGKQILINESFLIDEDVQESKQITLKNLPEENYTKLSFIIGVDSIHNCSGAQSGALDPINAMFWAWNTGYIFLKLEGKAPASKSPGNFFEYHIGGYKHPNNNIKRVILDLPESDGKESINIKTVNINVNVLELLKTPTTIDFEKLSAVSDHINANIIADNYADMFEVIKK